MRALEGEGMLAPVNDTVVEPGKVLAINVTDF